MSIVTDLVNVVHTTIWLTDKLILFCLIKLLLYRLSILVHIVSILALAAVLTPKDVILAAIVLHPSWKDFSILVISSFLIETI